MYKSSLVHFSICLFNEKTNGPFGICFSENKVCVAQALSNCLFFFTVYSVEASYYSPLERKEEMNWSLISHACRSFSFEEFVLRL